MRIFRRGGSGAAEKTHQTVRLDAGRHRSPGDSVCVMELASMLAGERFTDHPKSVCPTISALLRTYNDALGPRERQDLYRYASRSVGTRADYDLQDRRAQFALAWARSRQYGRKWGWRVKLSRKVAAQRNGAPVDIAEYVVSSLGRRRTQGSHAAMLGLLDWIIAMDPAEQGAPPSEAPVPVTPRAAGVKRSAPIRGPAMGGRELVA